MKKLLLHLLLRRAGSDPRFKRKLKAFVALSLVGTFLAGALVIWAGVSAYEYASHTVRVAAAGASFEPGTQPLLRPGCLSKASSMLNLTQWLERPLQESYLELRNACFQVR